MLKQGILMSCWIALHFVIKTCWKSLDVLGEDYITIKQSPSTAYVKYGSSALLSCTFDFKSLSEAEFEAYQHMQVLNDTQKKLTLSSEQAPAVTKANFSKDNRKCKFDGNFLSGIVFLEVKNLQPRDKEVYRCQAAHPIPPPYLEASSNGTYVYASKKISIC
ncbi:T-cell-specific surface glycoprotein CD28-like [Apteryx rowi]|uniref:T-cell-specific surface glycoprotein CD28-like n=1 Tax=Apteryx rowi TaxID=308060 RepID=UPI000E1C8ABA|nr:T-cell-specific surface glycoprotein CD28-like [Apteryx rowi]